MTTQIVLDFDSMPGPVARDLRIAIEGFVHGLIGAGLERETDLSSIVKFHGASVKYVELAPVGDGSFIEASASLYEHESASSEQPVRKFLNPNHDLCENCGEHEAIAVVKSKLVCGSCKILLSGVAR